MILGNLNNWDGVLGVGRREREGGRVQVRFRISYLNEVYITLWSLGIYSTQVKKKEKEKEQEGLQYE